MSKLLQLEICGIRSFNPGSAEGIKFATPLTIILGQNGCGKTTIIESILYAATGEIPMGTNQGQGFVNDPNMTLSCTTKGYVKLKFGDQLGKEVTIHRVAEVAITKTGLKFSSKASTIRILGTDGKEVNLGGRCVDITSECCRLMNVSQSVLNNVIFCHQENSTWPLEERKKLKERFDEIFDSEKYNKCVEKFKSRQKKNLAEIKTITCDLKYKSENNERVRIDKQKLKQRGFELVQMQTSIQEKNEEIEPITQRLEEICALENDLGRLQKQLAAKRETKKGLIEQQETILKNIGSDFNGSDEELANKIKDFEKEQQDEKDKVKILQEKLTSIVAKAKENDNSIQQEQEKLGQYKNQQVSNVRMCSQRDELLKRIKSAMNLSFTGSSSSEILAQLGTAYKQAEESLKQLADKNEAESCQLQKEIDSSRENFVSSKQCADMKNKDIREKESTKKRIDVELQGLSSADEDYNRIVDKLESLDTILANLKEKFNENEENEKIVKCKNEIQQCENLLNKYEREHRILQQNDMIEGKLESEKKLILQKSKDIDKLKSKHMNSLKVLFEKDIPQKRLKECVTIIQNKESAKVQRLTNEVNSKQNEESRLKFEQQNYTEKITSCREKLEVKQNRIEEICNGESFDDAIERAYNKRESLQREKGTYNSLQVIYGQFLKEFEKEAPCCPVCETNFSEKKTAVRSIVSTIKTKLAKVPSQLMEVEENLRKEEENYNNLMQIKPLTEEVEVIVNSELPLLEDKLADVEEKLKSATVELTALKEKLEQPQKIVDIGRNIISDVASIDQNQADIDKATQNVKSLESQRLSVDSMKSKFEIEAEIDTLKANISELRRKVDAGGAAITNHKDRIQQVTQQKSQVQNEQTRLRELIQKRPILEEQKTELSLQIESLNDEYLELQASISMLEVELSAAIQAKQSSDQENKKVVESERNKVMNYRQTIAEIDKLEREISEYVKNEIDSKLAATEQALSGLKNKSQDFKNTINKIQTGISALKEQWAKEEILMRNLQDAVTLRQKKSAEKIINGEIEVLKETIGGYNYESIFKEKIKLTEQRERVQKSINIILGEKGALEKGIAELRAELELPANKNAYQEFINTKYRLKLMQQSLEDLAKFIVALEESIVLFHRSKMIQINQNIRELWREIYRGNDIDFIEIKTETGTKKGYEYKLVQNKGGVELDMRGRCSAGQKVLACLIIRMALAESLSAHCGILALDEPTTNLDKENILSLSEAISAIVTSRKTERNFQLLVITHDEEFISILNRAQDVPYYYRVRRDNKGFSLINRQTSF